MTVYRSAARAAVFAAALALGGAGARPSQAACNVLTSAGFNCRTHHQATLLVGSQCGLTDSTKRVAYVNLVMNGGEIATQWTATNEGAGSFDCNGNNTSFASVWSQGLDGFLVGDNQSIDVATKAHISDGSTALSNTDTVNITVCP